jgi:hypothetical protein
VANIEKKGVNKMNFIEVLQNAVDEALSTLGEEGKQAVYNHLERKYNLPKEEIPYRIDAFSEALETLFGTASKILQALIMKHMFKRIRQPIKLVGKQESFDFNNYIESARIANICK